MTTRSLIAGSGGTHSRPSLAPSSPRHGERVVRGFLLLCAALSVAVTTAIVISLLVPSARFFAEVSIIEFLTGTQWAPRFATPSFGVLPIVVGTLMVVVFALSVAIPVGLLSAVYLSEYAPPRVRRVIKPALEVLEGIPTVAIGLFAFWFLRPVAEELPALERPVLDRHRRHGGRAHDRAARRLDLRGRDAGGSPITA